MAMAAASTATARATSRAAAHAGAGTATADPNGAATHPGATTFNPHTTSFTADADMVAAMSASPAVPARPATPSDAAPPGVTAPVKSWPMPAVIVPAIIPSAEEELDLFHIRWNGSRKEANGYCGGWPSHTEQSERKRDGRGANPTSHICLHP
jgi:hypothetical protein